MKDNKSAEDAVNGMKENSQNWNVAYSKDKVNDVKKNLFFEIINFLKIIFFPIKIIHPI